MSKRQKSISDINDTVSFDIRLVGAKIKTIRKSKNLTQTQVCEMAMIELTTVSRIEKNSSTYHKDKLYSPRMETIMKICYVLGVPLKDVL